MKKILGIALVLSVLPIAVVPCDAEVAEKLPAAPVRNPFIPQLPVKVEIIESPTNTTTGQSSANTNQTAGTNAQPQPRKTPGSTGNTEPVEPPLPKPNFRITGLIWNSHRPQAIINGEVLDIGDEIQGFRIESIKPAGIEVSIRGVTLTVEP